MEKRTIENGGFSREQIEYMQAKAHVLEAMQKAQNDYPPMFLHPTPEQEQEERRIHDEINQRYNLKKLHDRLHQSEWHVVTWHINTILAYAEREHKPKQETLKTLLRLVNDQNITGPHFENLLNLSMVFDPRS